MGLEDNWFSSDIVQTKRINISRNEDTSINKWYQNVIEP